MTEEFEKWAKQEGMPLERSPINEHGYFNFDTQVAWDTWQASRKQAIEECAVKAEYTICECCWHDGEVEAAQEIAFQIRTLQQQ